MLGSRVQRVLITIMTLSTILFLVIFLSSPSAVQAELRKETGKILLQLALIGILGAYAKFLLDGYAAARQQEVERLERERESRETKYKTQLEALNSLTTSYWEIKKAFHIIGAHRSAKSYGEQIRQIIDYRLKLQRLHNEIAAGLYGLDDQDISTIRENLSEMDTRLQEVIDEWKSHYLRLSRLQKQDEATNVPEQKRVPSEIDALPVLNQIGQDGFNAIHSPFESAAAPIRNQILESLEDLRGT
jgi:hypothetical protein